MVHVDLVISKVWGVPYLKVHFPSFFFFFSICLSDCSLLLAAKPVLPPFHCLASCQRSVHLFWVGWFLCGSLWLHLITCAVVWNSGNDHAHFFSAEVLSSPSQVRKLHRGEMFAHCLPYTVIGSAHPQNIHLLLPHLMLGVAFRVRFMFTSQLCFYC